MAKLFPIVLLMGAVVTVSARYEPACTPQTNYRSWGWDQVYVLANDLCTVAVVPSIGAHVLEYSLGGHGSMWRNREKLGRNIEPAMSWAWPKYGGFKVWPAPQAAWGWGGKSRNWPPPPTLEYAPATARITATTADSVVLFTEGREEVFGDSAKGLEMHRTMTMYRASSRIRVEQRILNNGAPRGRWAAWDVTNSRVDHGAGRDYTNFWAYMPRDTGDAGYFVLDIGDDQTARDQVKTGVAPGIVGLRWQGKKIKIGVHTTDPWIAYVDNRDGYAYIKKGTYVPGGCYPDKGSVAQVFVAGEMMEIEFLGPMENIPVDDSLVFVYDWYAARMHGPVVAVNDAGAINERLTFTSQGHVSGKYGVFYKGNVELRFDGRSAAAKTWDVSPEDSFVVDTKVAVPAGAGRVSLVLYDIDGEVVDTLDSYDVGPVGVARKTFPARSGRAATRANVAWYSLDGRRVPHSSTLCGAARVAGVRIDAAGRRKVLMPRTR